MSIPFLKAVAQDFYHNQWSKYKNPVLIFPNKRTVAYFRKYLAETAGKAEFSPFLQTIENFTKRIVRLNNPDKLSLIFKLYRSYKTVLKEKAANLSDFYNFADTLLGDFNELDSYLVDIKTLFTNIHDLAEISDITAYLTEEQITVLQRFWQHFNADELSLEKEKNLLLWRNIPAIYEHFTQSLLKENLAYPGLHLRIIVEHIKKGNFNPSSHYFLVGFNALNKAHHAIFQHFNKQDKINFYWDYDKHYITEKYQEAGFFLRKNLSLYKNSSIVLKASKSIAEQTENWQAVAVDGHVKQAEVVGHLLSEIPEDKTVGVILGDENLLFPILNNLPTNLGSFNITMGYPFQSTFLYSFIQSYFKLHKYALEFTNEQKKFYPAKLVNEIIENPLFKNFETKESNELRNMIRSAGIIRLNYSHLKEIEHPLFNDIFSQKNNASSLINSLLNVIYLLIDKNYNEEEQDGFTVEIEFLIQAYSQLKTLHELLVAEKANIDLSLKIGLQYLSDLSVPFTGEKLERIQIMGLMETRNLDFDYVIFTDLNEGKIPHITQGNSFIPQMLRKAFGLSITAYQDSIFAYLFYRLLQNSEKVYFLYNSLATSTERGEMSRYLRQLRYETSFDQFKNLKIDIKPSSSNQIIIEKDTQIVNKLKQYYSEKGTSFKKFSASQLNIYLKCSLQFYFKYIAELKQPEEDFSEMDYRDIGNILHKALETSYNKLKKDDKIEVKESDLPILENGLKELIRNLMVEMHQHGSFEELSGGQQLMAEIIETYCLHVFKYDISKKAPFKISGTEERINSTIPFQKDGKTYMVGFTGIIDRIDKIEGKYSIIDYKSGDSKTNFKGIIGLFERDRKKDFDNIFQILLYGYIYNQLHQNLPNLEIYPIRKIADKNFSPNVYLKPDTKTKISFTEFDDEKLSLFENYLSELLSDIFNEDIAFSQTDKLENCEYCAFKVICNR